MQLSNLNASTGHQCPARCAAGLMLLLATTAVAAATPALEVYPRGVHLHDGADLQQLVVRVVEPSGLTRDVTATAEYAWQGEAVASVRDGLLLPAAAGQSRLRVTFEQMHADVAVTVITPQAPRAISFRRDVIPTLTKTGCNMGSCHGSARGQDGFRLSLFGYDPAGDYQRLTRELPGRRVNLALPRESLLLTKATGSVPHTGGQRFSPDDPHYQTLLRWLRAGAPDDTDDAPVVTAIEVFPAAATVLAVDGQTQRLVVRAHYADGTDRDVTHLATFMSSNETAAKVDALGRVTTGTRGEAQILARFDAFTVGTPLIIVPPDAALPEFPATDHYIDQLIYAKLRRLRMAPSAVCSDSVFIRRVYLDLIGQLPPPARRDAFVANERPDKRARLVDELLERKEFVDLWVMKWAERLQLRSTQQVSYKAMLRYYTWLQQRIAAREPLDAVVRDLLTAEGGTFSAPPTNYFQLERDTLKLAENTAQVFMGPRLQCAQCHNHPFDRWTMDDYYGFAAFFEQIGRKPGEDPRETIVFNRGRGETKHPVDGRAMAPKFLGGETPELAGRDRRAVFAEWLTAPDNPFFARNLANFIWAHFFGRGIIEPVDDVRVSNPPSNAALLDALAERVVAEDYAIRALIRDICTSAAYQRSTRATPSNAGDQRNFARAPLRRLRAEVLLDVISQVTETENKFRGLPRGARAVQIADGNTSTYFLTTFGRAKRETVCTCEVTMSPSLSQALHLINGDAVHRKIHEGNVVGRLLEAGETPAAILGHLYRACLARPPTSQERETLLALLQDAEEPRVALEDAFWALLNSKEFVFNH